MLATVRHKMGLLAQVILTEELLLPQGKLVTLEA